MKEIIEKLVANNKTIATMESCTGGGLANAITNIEGVSDAFKFGAVTYSNEFKIKMGVSEDIINKYSVYSKETAEAMAKAISNYANANYGIGITGKLKRLDKNNAVGDDNLVYICIYDRDKNIKKELSIEVDRDNRKENKELVIKEIIKNLDLML